MGEKLFYTGEFAGRSLSDIGSYISNDSRGEAWFFRTDRLRAGRRSHWSSPAIQTPSPATRSLEARGAIDG